MPSRQSAYQSRNLAAGLCRQCGQPREHYRGLCDPCALIQRERMRLRKGYKPYRDGGPGRRPRVHAADAPARRIATAGPGAGAEGG